MINTRSMLFLLHIIFGQFLTVLWPLIDVRILFMLSILWINLWISIKLCTLTRCRFGWLNNIFHSFSTELWPLIDVEISFMLNILWTNWWILIKFCKCIDILNVGKDNYKLFFAIFQWSYGPWLMSEFCFHLISWEQIDGFWWNFVYAVVWLEHEIFLNFSTELWPLIDVKISIFRSNEWILVKFCLCIDMYDPCCD